MNSQTPLTIEEIKSIREYQELIKNFGSVWSPMLFYFCRSIEKKHGILPLDK